MQINEALRDLFSDSAKPIVLAIDGPAGSGKTTLAKELAQADGNSYTVHIDDLYEGWAQTLTPKLTEKLLKLLAEVRDENLIRFTPFNWVENKMAAEMEHPAPRFLILEGVGSAQSAIREFVSLSLWIEVLPDIGLERVIARDGAGVAQFMPAFLLLQDAHFEKEASKKSADYRLSGQGTV